MKAKTMSGTLKKKLCWNCEGRVGLEEQNCPFCAVYLGPAPNDIGERKDDILAPPYKIVDSQETEEAPYSTSEGKAIPAEKIASLKTDSGILNKVAIPVALLSGGLVFLLFSFVLYLFSTNGVLTLRWNGSYWYIYFIIALPLLLFGWKLIEQMDSQQE